MNFERLYNIGVKSFLLGLFAMGLIFSCANPLAPTGGPKDTLPPKVQSYTPEYGTKNFDQKRIRIEFDEYLTIKDQQKEFFVSPFTPIKPTVTMRGRGLIIEFQDTLLANQTYALNFGNMIRDNNEGNVLSSFRYVFSTGDEIDSLVMSGFTSNGFTQDSIPSAFILFFDAKLDTLQNNDSLMLKTPASFVARSQTYGGFIAENLKPIDYKVFAFEDTNYNQSYDPGVDKIGFLDTTYNPAKADAFNIWYDTTRKYMMADAQMYFRLFKENVFKRQYLSDVSRPNKHQVILKFSAANPEIESIRFDSLETNEIIVDYLKKDRDSVALWINVPSERVPDTLRGEIVSLKHDSVNVLRADTQKMELVWKVIDTRSRREIRKEEEDTTKVEENPFKLTVDVTTLINPLKHIPIKFEYPLINLDTAAISLIREADGGKRFRVNYEFEQDTLDMRQFTLKAKWQQEGQYSLTIPGGTFENVARQSNDTLEAKFGVISPEKYSKLVINVKGEDPQSTYILQLLKVMPKSTKILSEIKNVEDGTYNFEYLDPGTVRLRIIQDKNANGVWDTGKLVDNLHSERVEMFITKEGEIEITTKANWEIEFDVDMKDVFYPLTTKNQRDAAKKKQRALDKIAERERQKTKPVYQPQRGEGGPRGDKGEGAHDHNHDHDDE
ncbi:MAG: Ig-like domain-containing protein [Rikenellaceae bacterium]